MIQKLFLLFISLCCLTSVLHATDLSSYAQESVLSKGKWVKIKLSSPNSGIYKITYDELRKMGFSDPTKVSVHGYGGWPLDENFSNTSAYIDDLPSMAIYRGENYILFYGKGYVKWEYNRTSNTFVHTNNPYATNSYYFLTDEYGSREMAQEASTTGAVLNMTTYDEYRVHEQERVSPNKSGRELYGESFMGGGSQTISDPDVFNIPGITNDDGKVTMQFIARPRSTPGSASLSLNGQTVISEIGIGLPDDSYTVANIGSRTAIWEGDKSENIKAVVSYSKSGDENVYLDYIRLHVKRRLKIYGGYTFFRCTTSIGNVTKFTIQGADANTVVLDVTDGINPKLMETSLSGSDLSFTIPAGNELREFVAVQTNNTLNGWEIEQSTVPNQNLHNIQQTDMVIISPSAFYNQAERLAERHRTDPNDPLKVEVVTPEQIYNEFSSGTPDATAYRRFMKMFYDRNDNEADKPKYLLLFGDGAYDNRHLTTEWRNVSPSTFLLTYQSYNSLTYYSYVTDDYFGALTDESFGTRDIQLGIGRLPIRTLSQATAAVDKITDYMDNKVTGSWKNKLTFVADDGSKSDKPSFTIDHMKYANQIADSVQRRHPEFLVNKIFFDYYKKENGTYEDVKRSIKEQLNEGLLLINYTGHGSTQKWSDEDVLNKETIAGFKHTQLPLWITATCDFTRFDDSETSAGEEIFLSKSGGIALFTTTRVVDSNPNFHLNDRLIKELFNRDSSNRRLTLGQVLRNTKNSLSGNNKLNFILIGDPAMKLSYPEYGIRVTTINGEPVGNDSIPFRAQEKITIRGEVINPDSTIASGFSGSLDVTILDSKQKVTTLDNNGVGARFTFDMYPNTMGVFNSEVKDGTFEFSFYVPTNISYSNEAGIINMYAYDEQSGIEAQGSFQQFKVGGTSDNPDEDTEGPEIRLIYLNDSTFVEGGKVNTTPLFVARLWDKTGVDISGSSVGHDITLTIDNPMVNHNLNAYYKLLPDTDGEGLVAFSIPALTPGVHTIEFTVWDIFNNSTRKELTFEVVEDLKPNIAEIIATPVPARENIEFRIYHNRPGSHINATIMVFDLSGRRLWKTEVNGESDIYSPFTVNWDLRSNNGSRLRPGIYIYRAAIRTENSSEATKAKKLIILAQ